MTARSANARPRLLCVGQAESSHARAMADLFADSPWEVRFFALPTGAPPDDWPVTTYVSRRPPQVARHGPGRRISLYPDHPAGQAWRRFLGHFGRLGQGNMVGRWLSGVIRRYRPDIILTIGLRHAAYFLQNARERLGAGGIGAWVAQDWGPDLTMDRLLDAYAPRIRAVLAACDGYLADNDHNYAVARSLGLNPAKISPAGPVLACGGLDGADLAARSPLPPSRRERIILWPKAYNCPQTTAYPVLEALRLCHEALAPCRVVLTAVWQEEVRLWIEALPEPLRRSCQVHERLDREAFLSLLGSARVMLAPTLSDGFPNVLAEAMAMGTLPVVSALPPITAHIGPENALFARNLYPRELADTLVRAMGDNALADAVAGRNRPLAATLFDRATARRRLLDWFGELVDRTRTRRPRP